MESVRFSTTWPAHPTAGKIRGIEKVPHEAYRPEAGGSGALLLDRRHRLDADVSFEPGDARQMASGEHHQTLKDDDPLPPQVRDEYSKENGQLIDEGIEKLRKALELRPEYDDAMAYLNLLLRAKRTKQRRPRARRPVEAGRCIGRQGERNQAEKMEAPAKS